MTADDHEALIAREKPLYDGALPSGNAVALMNLVRLNALTLNKAYLQRAKQGFSAFSTAIEANPSACAEMLLALDDFMAAPYQVIVISGANGDAGALAARVRGAYLPGGITMIVDGSDAARLVRWSPLFEGKAAVQGKAAAFVCRNGTCQLPVLADDELMQQLAVR